MTSKHLYCKLFLEDCKRKIWAFALLGLIMFFVLPVATTIQFSIDRLGYYMSAAEIAQERLEDARKIVDFGAGYPVVRTLLFWTAIVLGIASFSYLHDKKQVDFYHSFPAKRSLLFLVHVGVGFFIPAVVYLIALVLEFMVFMVNGVLPFQVFFWAARGFVGHMLYYGLIYSTVVLAVMMTGTKIAAFLGTVVFFFYFPGVSVLLNGYCQTFFETYSHWSYPFWQRICSQLSPLSVFSVAVYDGMALRDGVKALAYTLVLSAASFFLYQKRPLEAAGKTMAFKWSKGIIKVLLVWAFGMAGAAFFYMIQDELGWMVFGAIVGVVISHCVIEVIYNSDFKKLFCHEKTMAACMTVVLMLSLSFYFDVFRYDAYLPGEQEVAQARIDFDEDHWVTYELTEYDGRLSSSGGGWHMLTDGSGKVQDIQAVLAVAGEGISQLDENFVNDRYDSFCDVVVSYTLKSGRTVYRKYDMYIDPVLDAADRIYGEADYKNALYPGLTLPVHEAAEHAVYRNLGENVQTLQGTKEQWEAVIKAYREELSAMTMTRRRSEAPVGELLLISDEDEALIRKYHEGRGDRYDRYGQYDGYFYPVYSTFTKTIQALADCDVQAAEHRFALEEIQGIEITAYGPFEEEAGALADPGVGDSSAVEGSLTMEDSFSLGEDFSEDLWMYEEEGIWAEETQEYIDPFGPYTVAYTDPEKIEAILKVFVDYSNRNKNSMLLTDAQYNVSLYISGREVEDTTDGFLIRGRVPGFVIEDLKKLEDEYVQSREGGEG